VTRLVVWWVRFYTRGLPSDVAERRVGEIEADLHDHIAHERFRGTADWRIGLSIVARMLRGLPADLSWRRHNNPSRAVRRIALTTGLILLVPLVLTLFDQADWAVFDFVLAGVLLGGSGLLLHALMTARSIVLRMLAAAIGVAAIVLGESDDAPGLVGFGCLLIAATVALAIRARSRPAG
jgi:hypothetical protein